MNIHGIPFNITQWQDVEPTQHPGVTGVATWRTRQFGPIRVRMVDYSPGYRADHWCRKGHILLVLSGEITTELDDGRVHILKSGDSFQVADDDGAHLAYTPVGASLFIVD
ncbi:MAG: DHCW motif cupin fold protein [Rhodospirillales bacterium]|nr:DHCW motif cupin fold protein [Rhodospirillales bacterium]